MKKKYVFSLILLFIFLFGISVWAMPETYIRTREDPKVPSDVVVDNSNIEDILKIPAVDAEKKIYDFADLFTEAEESKIYIQLNEYINNTGLDAAIVTTDTIKGFPLNEYTYNFYDYNDFKPDGIAFVIYKGPNGVSIFMGNNGPKTSEVFEAYTDNRIEQILKYVYENHIRSGDYVGACEDYIKLVDGFYIKTFGEYKVGEEKPKPNKMENYPWIAVIIISLTLSFIVVVLIFTKFKKPVVRPDYTIKRGLRSNAMIVKCEYDKPIDLKNISNS